MAEAIEGLKQGGDGHILVWGGVTLWRSLTGLDLIDEFRMSLPPYITNEGTPLFEGVPSAYKLLLIASTPSPNGDREVRSAVADDCDID